MKVVRSLLSHWTFLKIIYILLFTSFKKYQDGYNKHRSLGQIDFLPFPIGDLMCRDQY